MADDILSLLGGMKQPTPTESFAQNLLGYQRPSMSMEPMAQSMLGYQPSSIELDPMARTIQPSIMDRVSSGLGGIGSAFTGPGSNARLQALAASLLTGPSRTPISFGSQLAKGLLAGTQAAQAEQDRLFKRGLLEQEMDLAKTKLNIEKMKLTPQGDKVVGTKQFYDSEGNPVLTYEVKSGTGSLSYTDTMGNEIDITGFTTDKPSEASGAKFGQPKTAFLGDGTEITVVTRQIGNNFELLDATTLQPINQRVSFSSKESNEPKFGQPKTGYTPDGSQVTVYTKTVGDTYQIINAETGETVPNVTFEKPTSRTVTAEKPFSVQLTAPFSGLPEGQEVTIQSKTIDGVENLYANINGKDVVIPTGAFTTNYVSKADVLSAGVNIIKDLNAEIEEENLGLRALDKFIGYAETAEKQGLSGLKLKIASAKQAIKDFTSGELSEEGKLITFLRSGQNTTLGKLRVQILGPGVMTEYDAKRLIMAMGTDLNDWFANPAKLKLALNDIRQEKMFLIQNKERARQSWANGVIPEPSKYLTAPDEWFNQGGTFNSWQGLSETQKQETYDRLKR